MGQDFYSHCSSLVGVAIIRTIVFWGLYWGPLILGNASYGDNGKENGNYRDYRDNVGII